MYQQMFILHSMLLKAMAHHKRLEIIHLLRDKKLSVGDIQSMLGLPQANLSQHLQILRENKIVSAEKKGKHIYYSLTHPNFFKASDLLRGVLIERYRGTSLADEFTYTMDKLVPLVKDPVCGMRLSPKTAAYAYSEGSDKYYFCAQGCLRQFKQNITKFKTTCHER